MTSRRAFVVTAASTLAAPRALAQAAPRRIGLLSAAYAAIHAPGLRAALVDELARLGWVEGKSLAIENRYAEGRYERLPALAGELVRAKVELIAAGPTPAALAAQKATSTIPIVMLTVGEPVGLGLVRSLARPGGNVTGTAFDVGFDVFRKQVELLRDAAPSVRRVGVLINPANAGRTLAVEALRSAATSLGVDLAPADVRGPDDFDAAYAKIAEVRGSAVLVITDSMLNIHAARLAALAERHRLPNVGTLRAYVEAGGMMSYGPSFEHSYRRAAIYVDRILRGAKPADLPVEQPTQFELAVNLKTARALGVTFPATLLSRADTVVK